MAAKQPALSTQLKAANVRIAELEKSLKSANDMKELYSKRADEAGQEIEQVHALLDALPGAAGRKTSPEESWNAKDIKTMTRLAAYLANRAALA